MVKPIYKVLVVGGGTMGADIAILCLQKGMPVVVKEVNAELVERAKKTLRSHKLVQKGKITEAQLAGITVADNFDGLENEQGLLVIEAVPEILALKQKIFADLEKNLPKDAILTSNTSSLPIADLSAAMRDRSRLVGLHFFNPPTRMPLVEVIPSEFSSPEAVETAFDFSVNTLGKAPIRAADRPGFLVNVLLFAYLAPAMRALENVIVKPEEVDNEAKQFGWPMGPFFLMDVIGLDVCWEVAQVFDKAYGARMPASRLLQRLVELKRYGMKNGAGFYVYNGEAEPLEAVIAREFPNRMVGDAKKVFGEMMESFKTEAVLALNEGVSSKDDIESGCVFGLGFPANLQGPLHLVGGYFESW